MRTRVIAQPTDAKMGEIIKEHLSSQEPFFNKVWLVSAFANAQAIQRLAPEILAAKEHGARISMIVGFDVKSTSAEALRQIDSLGVNAILVHNARGGHTFHPKIYLFEANSEAEIFIGSSNLTDGGLYTNYEASSQTSFEFPQENREYENFIASLDKYLNPQGVTAQVLNEGLIDTLVKRGDVPTEKEIRLRRQRGVKTEKTGYIPDSPFGVEHIKRPPRLQRSIPKTPTQPLTVQPTDMIGAQIAFGDMLWQKTNLPASDVQRQAGNVTGGLRLTQAGWKVSGKLINQTTYFRDDVFGHLEWSEWKTKPYSEIAEADFVVEISGKSYGTYRLAITHKPSGEAQQGNYTTILHWGILAGTIRQLKLIGKIFSLYAPQKDQAEPFKIEII